MSSTDEQETKNYYLQQTMLRIKDPEISINFYTNILGMTLLHKMDFPEMKFSLYFLGYEDVSNKPEGFVAGTEWALSKRGTIELTHNWGTENDSDQKYHNGNSDPKGFGHIGIAVPDVYKACARFEELGVDFVKKPDEGKMKGLAFIKDPDNYWIEIFSPSTISTVCQPFQRK